MYRQQLPCTLAMLAVLAGCSSVDSTEPAALPPHGDCNAEAVQALLGETATAAQVEQARQQAGARSVRVLAPGDAVTLDYNSRRLNIEIDEAEAIERINCG
ncbi:I78 family peptidase inhibitor [Pseudomonas sp. sp1636]|uniref:I78 family peptidase inhibitor n=1 Tax=Pseudomonas sp. sp1636 TaxID=3036707 RepID=UPI0025A50E70|nr:I78 family peptidase inhibitor [Pseudomonas sp. sp1636]MDM8347370.1 I78 family peptidase inhibitor [Pseudomonas sp. sp1636]